MSTEGHAAVWLQMVLLATQHGLRPALATQGFMEALCLPQEALTNPSSLLGALTILWMWHLPHLMALFMPLFPQHLWDLGRQDWAPRGGVSEQLMDKHVLPKTAQRSHPNPEARGAGQPLGLSFLFCGVEAPSPLCSPPLLGAVLGNTKWAKS